MIDTMESKIQEILLATLPEQTAGIMKKFIEEANQLKHKVSEMTKELEQVKEARNKLKENFDHQEAQLSSIRLKLTSVEERENAVGLREHAAKLKELELDNTLLRKDAACSERVAANAHQFLSILVKNPVSEEYFFENKYYPGGYTNNKDGTTTHHNCGNIAEERKQRIETTK